MQTVPLAAGETLGAAPGTWSQVPFAYRHDGALEGVHTLIAEIRALAIPKVALPKPRKNGSCNRTPNAAGFRLRSSD